MKKKLCSGTQDFIKVDEDISTIVGVVEVEKPNSDLYSFVGKLSVGGTVHPLSLQHFIPKGSKLRNTCWIYGLIVYTG